MNLQQQVQQHLDSTGISLRELSRRSGVSHTTIGKILRGGTYKSDTAHALYSLISITPISEYVTLHDKVEAIAADRVDADKGAWDVDLNCAKYRRVMQLEAEAVKARVQADELKTELECSRIDVRKAETLAQVYSKDLQTMQASWKAACVQVEQLQKQLDHGQAQFASLHDAYNQQVDDEAEMLAQIDMLFTERANMRTNYEYSLMRLQAHCFALVCAIVFLIVIGLAVWGAK